MDKQHKIQQWKWNTSFCMQYTFTSKANKEKNRNVSLIPRHVFSKKIRYMLQCVFLYLQILAAKNNNLSAVCFGIYWTLSAIYWEFKNIYSKKPLSVARKTILVHSNHLIYTSLLFYGSWFGCQISSQMNTLNSKMRILWHNANLLELLNPENG